MNKDSFEHIIKEKVAKSTAEVPAGAWEGVASGLGTAGSTGVLGTLGAKLGAAVVTTAVIVGSVITVMNSSEKEADTAANKTETLITENQEETVQTEKNTPTAVTETESTFKNANTEENSSSTQLRNTKQPIVKTEVLEEENAIAPQITEVQEENSLEPIAEEGHSIACQGAVSEPTVILDYEPSKSEENKSPEPSTVTPSEIIISKNNEKDYTLSLNELSTDALITWYVNDENIGIGNSLNHKLSEGENHIQAEIISNGETLILETTESVILTPKLVVPNTFTPQSSIGYNDEFTIDTDKSENIDWWEVVITDLNGEILFRSSEAAQNWNGTLPNGTPAPLGTYAYVINYKSKYSQLYAERGTVVLQR